MFECNVRNLDGVYVSNNELLEIFRNGGTVEDVKRETNRRVAEANRCLEFAQEKGLTKMEFIEILESLKNVKKHSKYKKFVKKVEAKYP